MTVNDSLDLDEVDSTRTEEVEAALMRLWTHRGPPYGVYAGMRGLGHVDHPAGDFLPMMAAAYEVLVPIFGDWAEGA